MGPNSAFSKLLRAWTRIKAVAYMKSFPGQHTFTLLHIYTKKDMCKRDTPIHHCTALSWQAWSVHQAIKSISALRSALQCKQPPQHPNMITAADSAHSSLKDQLSRSSRLLQEFTHYARGLSPEAYVFSYTGNVSAIYIWARKGWQFL